MGLRLALAVAVASLGLSGPAGAARIGDTGPIDGGPFLAGKQVLWSETGCGSNCDPDDCSPEDPPTRFRILAWSKSRRRTLYARRLRCARSGPNFIQDTTALLVSESRLVLENVTSEGDEVGGDSDRVRVETGPLSVGPRTTLLRCTGQLDGSWLALDGDRVAYDPSPCDGEADRLLVRDLSTGALSTLALPRMPAVERLTLAGNFLALLRPGGVTVYDWAAAREAYRVAVPTGRFLVALALEDDGTLAAVTSSGHDACAATELTWQSPAEPQPHRLDAHPCGSMELRDRTVFLQDGRSRALVAIPLSGPPRTLMRLGPLGRLALNFDVRGSRLAYATPRCGTGSTITVRSVPGTPIRAGGVACPLRLGSLRLRVSSRGKTQVPLLCRRGCSGTLSLRSARGELAERDFELGAARGKRRLTLQLSRRTRQVVRRRGRLAASIRLTSYDRASRGHRTRRRAVLVAAP